MKKNMKILFKEQKKNDVGRKVKISDIKDNLDVSRLKLITEKEKKSSKEL